MIHHDNYSLQNCSFIHLKIFPFIYTQNYLQKSRMFSFRKRVLSETEIVPNCMQVMYLKTWKQEFSRLSSRCLKRDKKQPQLKKICLWYLLQLKKKIDPLPHCFPFYGLHSNSPKGIPGFFIWGSPLGVFLPISTHRAGKQTTRYRCEVFTEARHASKWSQQIHTADNEKKQ